MPSKRFACTLLTLFAVTVASATPVPEPCPNEGLSMKVLGYHVSWRTWTDPIAKIPWSHLTNLSYFAAVANPDGSVTGTDFFSTGTLQTLADTGDQMCVKVGMSLVVQNPPNTPDPNGCVLQDRIHAVLDPAIRTVLLDNIMATLAAGHAVGVDVDIEFPSPPVILPRYPCVQHLEDAQRYVDFVNALTQRVRAQIPNSYVYVSVPQWDYPQLQNYYLPLANASDGLTIMGYGYHYENNDPGPVSPVFATPGGGIWAGADPPYDLKWTLDYYQARGVPVGKLYLGFPFVGTEWPATTATLPGDWAGVHSLTFPAIKDDNPYLPQPVDDCERLLSVDGKYDDDSSTPYRVRGTAAPYRQLFCEDLRSMTAKFDLALSRSLAGIFFWAENYLPAKYPIWKLLDDKLKTTPPANQAPAVAIQASQNAQQITLTDTGTSDPDGDMLIRQWAMASGPPAADDAVAAANASAFVVTAIPGQYTFTLTATDGVLSTTGSAQVVVPGDTSPPSATLPTLSPVATGTVIANPTASDDIGVERVELLVDGGVVDTDTSAPYQLSWNTAGFSEAAHAVQARAKDWSANPGTSTAQWVIVDRTLPAPIAISGPSNPHKNTNFTMTVTASDANKIATIVLYEVPTSGPLIVKGSATVNPPASPATRNFTLNYPTKGARRLRASATDPAGNVGWSADFIVNVKN